MANSNIAIAPTSLDVSDLAESQKQASMDERLQKKLDKFLYGGGRGAAQKTRNFLNGTWLGDPLHAALTDLPVGIWTMAMVFDVLDLIRNRRDYERAADTSVAVGLACALGAAVAGATDWSDVDPPARRIGFIHGLLNLSATSLFAGQEFPKQFVAVLPEAQLEDNKPTRVVHNGVPILLVRRDQRIFALAETCSHFSGPLSEGKLEGDSIACPLHYSRFALEDGHVINGPAVHPQPCLEVRVRDGQIEVRIARE